jgi:hypothetical protein
MPILIIELNNILKNQYIKTCLMTNFSFMLQGNLIVHFTMSHLTINSSLVAMGFEWNFFQINFLPTFFKQIFGIFILRNHILTYTKDSSL